MGNTASSKSSGSPSVPLPSTTPAEAMLEMHKFDMALYALYMRGVAVAELAMVRGELRSDSLTSLRGDALLQACLLVAVIEVLNEPNQPMFEPGICLLPGQTVPVTRANSPEQVRPIVALGERVKHLLQKADQQRRLRDKRHLSEGEFRWMDIFTMADLRVAAFLPPEEQASSCSQDVLEVLSQTGLILKGYGQVGNHSKIQRAAMKVLRSSPVLSGIVQMSPNAVTVPVRPVDVKTFGVTWINVDPNADTLSSVLKKIRVTSQVDDSVDTRLTDMSGNSLADEDALMAHVVSATNTIVVHADVHNQGEIFMSRITKGTDIDEKDGDDDERQRADSSPPGEGRITKMPKVPGSLILGNVGDVQKLGIHGAVDKWISEHGDIVKVRFLDRKACVVRRAAFARQILARQNKNAPHTHVGGGSAGLFFADGVCHKDLRRDLNPCFYSKSINLLYDDILETVDEFVDSLKHRGIDRNENVNMWQWSIRLFYDSMARAGLGCAEEATTLREIRDHGDKRASYPKILLAFEFILEEEKKRQIVQGGPMPWMNDLPTPANLRYREACDRMYKEAAVFVDNRIRKRDAAAAAAANDNSTTKRYFLDAVLDSHGVDRSAGFIAARAQVLNFFRAGTDTTAAALCWTFIELSRHPEVEQKLLKEIDEVVGMSGGAGDAGSPPPLEKLWHGMPYLDAVLKEVMRHNPPANLLIRGVDEESGGDLHLSCEAGLVGYDGKHYVVPEGMRCFVDIIGIHKDPRYWKNPAAFNPLRFLSGDPAYEDVEAGAYLPYGGGPRTCIGNMFGILEVKVALVQVLRKYTLESIGEPVKVTMGERRLASGSTLRMRERFPSLQASDGLEMKSIAHRPDDPMPSQGSRRSQRVIEDKNSPLFAKSDDITPLSLGEALRRESIGRAVCAFGSNQGTCENLSEKLASEWARLVRSEGDSLGNSAVPLDALDLSELTDPARAPSYLLICTSTYNGAPPENARRFVASIRKLLQSAHDSDKPRPLEHMAFAVFGLGNSNWSSTYQQIPDEVNRTLCSLGAQPIYPMAVADASDGPSDVEEAFAVWSKNVWMALGLSFPSLEAHSEQQGGSSNDPSITQNEVDAGFQSPLAPPMRAVFSSRPLKAPSSPTRAQRLSNFTVVEVKRLTSDGPDTQEVCQVTMESAELGADGPLVYFSGDHFEVQGRLHADTVNGLCLRLGLNPASYVTFFPVAGNESVASISGVEPGVTSTILEVLSGRDISVSQRTVQRLHSSGSATSKDDIALLRTWAHFSKEEFSRVQEERGLLTICDLLEECMSVHISLDDLMCAYTTQLRNRYYSISSSPQEAQGKSLTLTVGVVDELHGEGVLPEARRYVGISSWALTRPENIGAIIRAQIKQSSFRLPVDPETPVIFACGGTGIAPFRAFWHERALSFTDDSVIQKGKTILYFGCRDRRHMLYENELKSLHEQGVLDVRLALSREPGEPKSYVQQEMLKSRAEIFELLTRSDKPAQIYVCGSVKKIGAGVHNALIDILTSGGDANADVSPMTESEAQDWLADAEHTGQYHRDVWG